MAKRITDAERVDRVFISAAPEDLPALLERVMLIVKARGVIAAKRTRKPKGEKVNG